MMKTVWVPKGKSKCFESQEVVEVLRNVVQLKNGKVWNLKRVALCGKKEENKGWGQKNYARMDDNVDFEGSLDVEGKQPVTQKKNLEGQSMEDYNNMENMDEVRKSDDVSSGNVEQEELEECEEVVESDAAGFKRKIV
ncbi:hypothetical protein NDU88_005711 [Pleurodeles waltl]|uniref:Uncharacterized protein n=1 Tax=Pleurodeles waltl TaxID=8319 RepID=A0AAV7WYG2_PLEWA|nr:hypothetical protein NDU88_005711 [Pleurodeles waltl]